MGVIVALLFVIVFIVIIKKLVGKSIDNKTSSNLGFLFKVAGVLLALFILLTFLLIVTYK